MNSTDHTPFDRRLQALHAQAVDHVSPYVRARLRPARRAARPQAWGWSLAAACAIGVLAIGLEWRRDLPPVATAPAVASATAEEAYDPFVVLDENPDLYLWLASGDAATLAME